MRRERENAIKPRMTCFNPSLAAGCYTTTTTWRVCLCHFVKEDELVWSTLVAHGWETKQVVDVYIEGLRMSESIRGLYQVFSIGVGMGCLLVEGSRKDKSTNWIDFI